MARAPPLSVLERPRLRQGKQSRLCLHPIVWHLSYAAENIVIFCISREVAHQIGARNWQKLANLLEAKLGFAARGQRLQPVQPESFWLCLSFPLRCRGA